MKTKLIIFGITGDLSQRKLLPALRHIIATGEAIEVIGVSRRQVQPLEIVGEALADQTKIFTMDLADASDYDRLRSFVALNDDEQALVYLSVPPSAAADIVDFLGAAGFNSPNTKLLFEKPFGFDLASAQDFLTRTARYYKEEQLYRIDHYAAKEVAQQLRRLRADASHHHHTWSNKTIAAIEIVASEVIGVEDRAIFYEQTGALRDFIQGHLLQLLALVIMEGSDNTPLSTRRLYALEHIEPADPRLAIRAQYDGYDDEVHNPGSRTETFAQVHLQSNDPHWSGVSMVLTTGKSLDVKRSALIIHYRDGAQEVFDESVAQASKDQPLDAYERVLIEAIKGDKTVFTTGQEVLRAWEIVAPLQEAWQMDNGPLLRYAPGSSVDDVGALASNKQH